MFFFYYTFFFFFNDTATTEIYTLSLHDALPISGYQRLTHFIRIGYDETDLKVIVEPLLVRLTRSVRARSRHYDEFLFGFLVFRGRRATGIDWTPRSAALRHSAPADRSIIERAFRCRVAFGAPRAELAFDRALGDTPLVQADSPLHAVMLEYAES